MGLSIVLIFPTVLPSTAIQVSEVPNPRQFNGSWVSDVADLLSPTSEHQLNQLISELEATNGAEIAVVTVPNTQPSPTPKDFATELFNTWGIGKEGADNGVLFLVSKGDRRTEVETGYGVEAVLPDAKVGEILRNQVTPRFKEGDFDTGILLGTEAIADSLRSADFTTVAGPLNSTKTLRSIHRFSQNLNAPTISNFLFSKTGQVVMIFTLISTGLFKLLPNSPTPTSTTHRTVRITPVGHTVLPKREPYSNGFVYGILSFCLGQEVKVSALNQVGKEPRLSIIWCIAWIVCCTLLLCLSIILKSHISIALALVFPLFLGREVWLVSPYTYSVEHSSIDESSFQSHRHPDLQSLSISHARVDPPSKKRRSTGQAIWCTFVSYCLIFLIPIILAIVFPWVVLPLMLLVPKFWFISGGIIISAILASAITLRENRRSPSKISVLCRDCDRPLNQVSKTDLIPTLNKSQQVASEINSTKYWAWHCDSCSVKKSADGFNFHLFSQVISSRFSYCHDCQAATVRTEIEILKEATLRQSGKKQVTQTCACCQTQSQFSRTIPRKKPPSSLSSSSYSRSSSSSSSSSSTSSSSSSSSSNSSSSSSSGGGSFGGGSSGGGGAGDSW